MTRVGEEIATHHDCRSVAYRIAYKGVAPVLSGDMDASALPNLVRLAKGADLLIFNCAALDPPESPSQLYELHTPPSEKLAKPGEKIDSRILCQPGCFRNRQTARPCNSFVLRMRIARSAHHKSSDYFK
jgi:hypothetical protein